MRHRILALAATTSFSLAATLLGACSDDEALPVRGLDAGPLRDGSTADSAPTPDAAKSDASTPDATTPDTSAPDGSAVPDTGAPDAKPDAAPNATPDAAPDGPAAVNGCTTFVDATAAGGTINWVRSVGSAADRCTKVKVGQTVTWNGSMPSHPLAASGGTTPSPIVTTNTGTTVTFTFAAAGTFGFVCQFHPDMLGAILVVP